MGSLVSLSIPSTVAGEGKKGYIHTPWQQRIGIDKATGYLLRFGGRKWLICMCLLVALSKDTSGYRSLKLPLRHKNVLWDNYGEAISLYLHRGWTYNHVYTHTHAGDLDALTSAHCLLHSGVLCRGAGGQGQVPQAQEGGGLGV